MPGGTDKRGNESFFAVTNVGVKPTVDSDGQISCESYLLDFSGDLYGKTVEMLFYKRLRSEKKFASRDDFRLRYMVILTSVGDGASEFGNK